MIPFAATLQRLVQRRMQMLFEMKGLRTILRVSWTAKKNKCVGS